MSSHERTIEQQLDTAGVRYTKQNVFSNDFHGTRFVFVSRKEAKAAEKATGLECNAYFSEWCITVY